MFFSFWVIVDVAFFHVPKALAHVEQEVLVDVVIQSTEGDLFRQDQTDVILIILKHSCCFSTCASKDLMFIAKLCYKLHLV